MTSPDLTIGLLWHSVRSGNLGVGALTDAHLALLNEAARSKGISVGFVTIGWVDRGTRCVIDDNLETVEIRSKDFLPITGQVWKAARRCHLVFDIGLGDSFTDIYGLRRFATQALSKLLVLGSRTPLVLAPQTIGPFSSKPAEAVARRILRSSAEVCTRDELSTEYVHRLDPAVDVVEVTDLAMALPFEKQAQSTDDGRSRIGFNVSGLLMAAGKANRFGLSLDYPGFARNSIRSILERPDTEVHLVAHVLADEDSTDDDNRWCRELAEEFPDAVLAPRFETPRDAKSYIAGLDALIGARMHACIAAFSSGVPVLPVAYSRKFAGLFRTLGYTTLIDAGVDDERAAGCRRDEFLDDLERHREALTSARVEAERRITHYEATVTRVLCELLEANSPVDIVRGRRKTGRNP